MLQPIHGRFPVQAIVLLPDREQIVSQFLLELTMPGPTTCWNGQTGVAYSVATVTGATTYSWTVPTGATVVAGQGTKTITITFGATSGSVCVTASNACGTSNANCLNISVDTNGVVGNVGTITGPSPVCATQTGLIYSVPAVTGATTY